MFGVEGVDKRAGALQEWLLSRPLTLPSSPGALLNEIRAHLLAAAARGALVDPGAVHRLVKMGAHDRFGPGAFAIVGAAKHFGRDQSRRDAKGLKQFFERDDGGWFDFAFTVRQGSGVLTMLAYNIEIRFDANGERWFRVDLNPPSHANEIGGKRTHCHPAGYEKSANRTWSAPYPTLSPVELLDLFVYGFREVVD